MKMRLISLVTIFLFGATSLVNARSGKINDKGYHMDKKTKEMYSHNKKVEKLKPKKFDKESKKKMSSKPNAKKVKTNTDDLQRLFDVSTSPDVLKVLR